MNKSLSKIIIQKSEVRNKYLKWPSRQSLLNYKKIKNKRNSFVGKSKKEYFQNVSNVNSSYSKHFGMLSNLLCELKVLFPIKV